jgi:endo-1,4-beta-xylanase
MTSGYPSDATENSVQADINSVGYGSNTGGTTTGGTSNVGPTSGATGGCTGTYSTTDAWSGGFQGGVKVTASNSAVNDWTVHRSLASGQSISQVWNGTLSTSGSNVTVKNVSYNSSLSPSASTAFGFLANGTASTPTLTCTSP